MNNTTVLIVDDEKNIRLTLTRTLEAIALPTDSAMNGEEALEKLKQQTYALMLLDIKMPGMDGIGVLAETRKIRPHMPVIMITAHGTVDNAVEAMKLGATDFIQKPFAPQEIRELVTRVLERQRLEPEHAVDYETRLELIKKCLSNRQFVEAETYLRQAIAQSPQRPEAITLLGILLEMQDRQIEALKLYRAALSLDPTYQLAQQNLNRAATWESEQGIILE
jgi:DNA-binding NtrC family response regulator